MMDEEQTNQLTFYAPLSLGATHPDSPAAGGKGKRREYKTTLIAAGFVRRRDGQPSNFYIPADALRVAAPLFQSAAVFVDHPQEGVWDRQYPETKHLAGVVHGPEWNEAEQGIEATLRLNSRSDMHWLAELLDEVIEDQAKGEPAPDVGLPIG
jgi:hypothetical protein